MFWRRRAVVGSEGEDSACRWLEQAGYRIRERNVRTRYGELDIIAEHAGALVFVEVKARRTGSFGTPQEAVTRAKQSHMARAALSYVKQHRLEGRDLQFAAIAVGPAPGRCELIPLTLPFAARYTV